VDKEEEKEADEEEELPHLYTKKRIMEIPKK
jgi:hypothetical protein